MTTVAYNDDLYHSQRNHKLRRKLFARQFPIVIDITQVSVQHSLNALIISTHETLNFDMICKFIHVATYPCL